jgi:hypothetical protein
MAYEPNHLTISRLEKIARDLAAVLSPEGEADWRRFVVMAEEVGTRLYQQLAQSDATPARQGPSIGPQAAELHRTSQPDRPSHAGAVAKARPRLSAAA